MAYNDPAEARALLVVYSESEVDTLLAAKAPLASPTFTGTVAGITKAMVGLGNADNTSDAAKPVSTAGQTALDLKAPLASPTFTGTVAGVTKAMVGLGSVDNTADTAKPVSTAQQTALNLKAPLASPTFTGTVAGVTKAMVGLGSVDNTADTAKPVSTAQQTALDLKAPLASPTLTGVPAAPTAAPGTDTTQIATTAFVAAGDAAAAATVARLYDTALARAELNRAFTAALTGADRSPIAVGTAAVHDDLGGVWLLDGADAVGGYQNIAPIGAIAVEDERIYQARVQWARVTDPVDPAGHAVELRMQSLSKSRSHVSNVLIHTFLNETEDPPGVADGVQELTFTFSRTADVADYQCPATTRYAVPYLKPFGGDHETAVAVIEVKDITDLGAFAGDVAALDEALTAEIADREAGDIAVTAAADAALDAEAARQDFARGGFVPLGRHQLHEIVGSDDRRLIGLDLDTDLDEPRWEGHARVEDVAAVQAEVDAISTGASQTGGFVPADRHVVMEIVGSDGRIAAKLLHDPAADAARWDGHALLSDLSGGGAAVGSGAAVGDRVFVNPVGVRARPSEIGVKTELSGYGWTRLPPMPTPHFRGASPAGATLQVRRSAGLKFGGRRYRGTYDPGALDSIRSRGRFTTAYPTGSFLAGDYVEQSAAAGNTVSATVYANGDLAVWNGSAWVKQAAPATAEFGDYWVVSGAGMFKEVELSVNDRMVYDALESNGLVKVRHWRLGDVAAGEVFLRGETATPSSSPPASPLEGDLWQATAAEGAYAVDDGLLRLAAAWVRVPTAAVASVSGAYFIDTGGDASNIEVRRSDKSATPVDVNFTTLIESRALATSTRDLTGLGDSMMTRLGPQLGDVTGRSVAIYNYPGGTAPEILSMIEREIRGGNLQFDSRTLISWQGTNSIQEPETAMAVNAMLAGTVAARDGRILFMSPLGQYELTWSGTRIEALWYEDQFNDNVAAAIVEVRDNMAAMFPDTWFDTRAELCATAGDTPCLIAPGMTEAEAAETYGWIPFSYYFDLLLVDWTPEDLTFIDYWTDPGLPGPDGAEGDYYIRSVADGSDPIGQLIVFWGGTWAAHHLDDIVHMRPVVGNVALAERIDLTLTAKGW